MAKPLVDDALWERIEPLLPVVQRRYRYPGRKRIPDRRALTGILFVLKTGIAWEDLPAEMGCGSGMTCWRRLRDWNDAGVWTRLHQVLLDELHEAGGSTGPGLPQTAHTCEPKGGRIDRPVTGRSLPSGQQASHDLLRQRHPAGVDRDRCQPQRHHPVARARRSHRTNRPARQVPPQGAARRPRLRQSPPSRRAARRGIAPKIAKRNTDNGSGLGTQRWVVERTFSWLHNHRRLARAAMTAAPTSTKRS
jgi:transposase